MTNFISAISIRPIVVRAMCAAVLMSATGATMRTAAAQSLTEEKPPRERDRDRDRQGNQDDARRNADDPTRAELRKRFEARLDRLDDLKARGFIGETFDGAVEALDERLLGKDQRSLLDDENADRKSLYALIAARVDEGEKRVPPRVVAQRNARRNFEKSDPRHFLKTEDGRWIQKRDEDRARRIARLKEDGAVGETYEGYLDAVQRNPDEDVQRLVEQENRDRRAMYDQIAGRIDDADAEQIARQAGKAAHEALPAGHYFKSKEGAWERRPDRRR